MLPAFPVRRNRWVLGKGPVPLPLHLRTLSGANSRDGKVVLANDNFGCFGKKAAPPQCMSHTFAYLGSLPEVIHIFKTADRYRHRGSRRVMTSTEAAFCFTAEALSVTSAL
jgi:hypothetical protein